ncbi:aldehyde dehydrogenase (NAD+) [Enterococcus sp. DIV2402]|uniref:aldehyde dehydrogenase (NAD(+)) n=1 Tax=Candidatus Enterococcus lowellii TaxID=2230877 RepID=A0ABZ2SRF6_9ENTE|nr:aldehyde dehydrogenase family protein [Enterococcus sp. DIV2402]MBO0465325.1 aldehyde dehydrogenase family protein [Enterococcus sp. DIV2402]
MKKYEQLFYDGNWQTADSQVFSDVVNPATEEVIAQVIQATHKDVDNAVAAAKKAFSKWNTTALKERAEYLEKVLAIIKRRQTDIQKTIIQELGASKQFTKNAQVPLSIREMEATLSEFATYSFEETVDNAKITKEGYGVVACVTPWNYPFNQIQRKITPALLAGNTVVVKPASNTPLTAILYAEIMEEAGLPKGVFNLITGSGGDAGDYLVSHPDVEVISFTGSTEVGKNLYHHAATTVKKLVLELGGKSAMVYLKGGDLSAAVEAAASTVLDNQGQTCSALSRLLVPSDELEQTKQLLKEYYATIQVGDPAEEATRVGPMVSESQRKTVLEYIQKGQEEGAEILVGGQVIEGKGYFVEPTVFVNVTNDMTIAQEEIFGPVLTVVTYDTVEEAIELANDSVYGLSGAVVGPTEEAEKVARQLRTGNVIVNGGKRTAKAPFGGYKQSGLGRENGLYGLEDYLETKAIFL